MLCLLPVFSLQALYVEQQTSTEQNELEGCFSCGSVVPRCGDEGNDIAEKCLQL